MDNGLEKISVDDITTRRGIQRLGYQPRTSPRKRHRAAIDLYLKYFVHLEGHRLVTQAMRDTEKLVLADWSNNGRATTHIKRIAAEIRRRMRAQGLNSTDLARCLGTPYLDMQDYILGRAYIPRPILDGIWKAVERRL